MISQFYCWFLPQQLRRYRKQFALGDKMVMADMLDTAGMEEFSAMRDQWMRTHDGFIIVFGLDSRSR